MSTRSLIGKVQADGTVRYIYCHSDGYVSYVGITLHEHYQDEVKIDALLDLGSLSSLGSEIGEKHSFDFRSEFWSDIDYGRKATPGQKAEYERLNAMCMAYHRDRGETLRPASAPSVEEFWKTDHWTEFWYLRQGDTWLVKCHDDAPIPLAQAIFAEDA